MNDSDVSGYRRDMVRDAADGMAAAMAVITKKVDAAVLKNGDVQARYDGMQWLKTAESLAQKVGRLADDRRWEWIRTSLGREIALPELRVEFRAWAAPVGDAAVAARIRLAERTARAVTRNELNKAENRGRKTGKIVPVEREIGVSRLAEDLLASSRRMTGVVGAAVRDANIAKEAVWENSRTTGVLPDAWCGKLTEMEACLARGIKEAFPEFTASVATFVQSAERFHVESKKNAEHPPAHGPLARLFSSHSITPLAAAKASLAAASLDLDKRWRQVQAAPQLEHAMAVAAAEFETRRALGESARVAQDKARTAERVQRDIHELQRVIAPLAVDPLARTATIRVPVVYGETELVNDAVTVQVLRARIEAVRPQSQEEHDIGRAAG